MKNKLSLILVVLAVHACSVPTSAQNTTATTKSDSQVHYEEKMPEFDEDLMEFIAKNTEYPKDAKRARIEGRVKVKFVINENGTVTGAKVIQSLYPSLDAER